MKKGSIYPTFIAKRGQSIYAGGYLVTCSISDGVLLSYMYIACVMVGYLVTCSMCDGVLLILCLHQVQLCSMVGQN